LNCAAYVRAASAGDHELAQYSGYLAGYVSAYNEHRSDTFDLLPWQSMETMMLLMLSRCRDVPETSFGVAVIDMAKFFERGKLGKLEERVQIGDEESAMEVYAPVAAEIRAALAERGYPVDDLNASLKKFRLDQNLPPATNNMQMLLMRLLYTSVEQ
jgi:hypothetical protein